MPCSAKSNQLDLVTKSVWMEERRPGKRDGEGRRERGKRERKGNGGRREKIVEEEREWKDGGRKKSTDTDDW